MWHTINGATGRKDKGVDANIEKLVDEIQAIRHIVLEIFARVNDGFSDISMCRKVDRSSDFIVADCLLQSIAVRKVRLDQGSPFNSFAVPHRQIVIDHRPHTGLASIFVVWLPI